MIAWLWYRINISIHYELQPFNIKIPVESSRVSWFSIWSSAEDVAPFDWVSLFQIIPIIPNISLTTVVKYMILKNKNFRFVLNDVINFFKGSSKDFYVVNFLFEETARNNYVLFILNGDLLLHSPMSYGSIDVDHCALGYWGCSKMDTMSSRNLEKEQNVFLQFQWL